MKGYIKLQRNLVDWTWYKDINVKTLFLHCLIKAAYSDCTYKGLIIKRGQFMSTLEQLAEETGLSISQVRTAIKKLKQTNDLETTSSNRSTLFCVVNYDVYQNIDKKETDEEEVKKEEVMQKEEVASKEIEREVPVEDKEKEEIQKDDKQIANKKQIIIILKNQENQGKQVLEIDIENGIAQLSDKQMTNKSQTRKEYKEKEEFKNNKKTLSYSAFAQERENDTCIYEPDSFEMSCVNKIIASIQSLPYSDQKGKSLEEKQRECEIINQMQQVDKINKSDILTALDYALNDSFWSIHVKSAQKFRKHFVTIINKAKAVQSKSFGSGSNNFNNITPRDYNYHELERALLG